MKALNERLTKAMQEPTNITLTSNDIKGLNLLFDQLALLSTPATIKWNLGTDKWNTVKEMIKHLGPIAGIDEDIIKLLINPKH